MNHNIYNHIKRIIDMIMSIALLVISSPIFVFCYIAIKREDGGSVIFRQERIGQHGKPFMIYKFRSTRREVKHEEPHLFTMQDNSKLTNIGRILRKHHLDELPQLWNILKGDMAFVGHRPERKFYIDQIMQHDNRYEQLYQLRPGATSYATIYNGYTDTMEKMLRRLELDLDYLEHMSFSRDLKILFTTFFCMLGGKRF